MIVTRTAVINTVLFPCMTDNGRKVHITATYHRRNFLSDLKHYWNKKENNTCMTIRSQQQQQQQQQKHLLMKATFRQQQGHHAGFEFDFGVLSESYECSQHWIIPRWQPRRVAFPFSRHAHVPDVALLYGSTSPYALPKMILQSSANSSQAQRVYGDVVKMSLMTTTC